MIFRSHSQVPAAVASPTLRALLEEWVELNQHPRSFRTWHPRFGPCRTPGDVVDLLDATPVAERDDLFYALVTGGSYLAWRILLQTLLPAITAKARRRPTPFEDALQDCIYQFWEACGSYPSVSRRYVALNLTRTPAHLCASTAPPKVVTVPLDEDFDYPCPESTGQAAAEQLDELFTQGLACGAVTKDDLHLLHLVAIEHRDSAAVGDWFGLTPQAVRKRCQRVRQRLSRSAIDDH